MEEDWFSPQKSAAVERPGGNECRAENTPACAPQTSAAPTRRLSGCAIVRTAPRGPRRLPAAPAAAEPRGSSAGSRKIRRDLFLASARPLAARCFAVEQYVTGPFILLAAPDKMSSLGRRGL